MLVVPEVHVLVDGGIHGAVVRVDHLDVGGFIHHVERPAGIDVQVASANDDFDIRLPKFILIHVHRQSIVPESHSVFHILQVDLVFQLIVQFSGRIVLPIRYHPAVLDSNHPVRVEFRDIRLVSHQNYQPILGNRLDDVHNFDGISAVQVSRRLIGDDDLRVLGNGPGDGHPLPLSAGQGIRHLVPIRIDAHRLQAVVHPFLHLLPILYAHHSQGNGHVFKDGAVIQQVVVLENISNFRIPDDVHLVGTLPGDAFPVHVDLSRVDSVQPADGIQQRGFTAAGRAQQCHDAAFRQIQGGVVNDMNFVVFLSVEILIYILKFNHIYASSL